MFKEQINWNELQARVKKHIEQTEARLQELLKNDPSPAMVLIAKLIRTGSLTYGRSGKVKK